MTSVAVVVAARNEQKMIEGCLDRLGFADEVILVVDDRSTDRTAQIGEQWGASVRRVRFENFAQLKNAGIAVAQSRWVMVVDADERVSRQLAQEVCAAADGGLDAYRVPIVNWFYGHRMDWGGWQEHPIRLVRRELASYRGDIHETFSLPSHRIGMLKGPLHHFSHRSILDNLQKTAIFGDVQAREMLAAGAPPVTARRLYATVLREVLHRLVLRRGWRDGVPGVIEGLYQPLSLFCVQARLWELQQEPPIADQYLGLEELTW